MPPLRCPDIDDAIGLEQPSAGSLDEAAVAAHGAAARAQRTEESRRVVGPGDDLAAIAVLERIGLNGGIRRDVSASRVLYERVPSLIVAADQHRAAAGAAGGIERSAGHDPDLLTQHLDAAARSAGIGAARADSSRIRDGARAEAFEPVNAVDLADGVRFDDPGVVDHCTHNVVSGPSAQPNAPAVGLDELPVLGKRPHYAAIHAQADKARAAEIQGHLSARCERDRAQARLDHAVVLHRRAD